MPKPKILIKDSYLAMIKNSAGSKMFRNLFFNIDGKKTDILNNGDLSCAVFVSSILHYFRLIREPHTTVNGTIEDMEKLGWHKIKKPIVGSLILWDYKLGNDGQMHKHVGFYLGDSKAISNNSEKGFPIIHDLTFGKDKNGNPRRKIVSFYWHKKLD